MASIKEKIAYALGDAAAGGIVWKVMSIAFPLFFTNVFGLSFADAAPSVGKSHVHNVADVFLALGHEEVATGLSDNLCWVFQGSHVHIKNIAQA